MKIMQRKHLLKKLKIESEKELIFVCAPMGYGKTTGVKEFLSRAGEDTIWISMDGEFEEEWIWDKLQSAIMEVRNITDSQDMHGAIPATRKENEDWVKHAITARDQPLHIILDDFTWGIYKKLESWLSFCFWEMKKELKIWILAREMPEGKLLERVYQQKAGILKAEDFIFSKEDIHQLAKKEGLELKEEMSDFISQYTHGWAAAIQLILLIYREDKELHKLSALDELIKVAFYDNIQPEMKISLMKLSIFEEFSFEQAEYICENRKIHKYLNQLMKRNRFVHQIGENRIQIMPVCREMLTRELMQSDIDQEELFDRAGDWFLQEDNGLEAIRYYKRYGNFEKIIHVIDRYGDRSMMDIAPDMMKSVFKKMPALYRFQYPYIYMKWILDVITNIDIQEGMLLLESFRSEIEQGRTDEDADRLLGEYYFARAFTKFNDIRKMEEDFRKAYEILGKNGIAVSGLSYPQMTDSYGADHMLYLYFNQPGDLKDLVKEIKEKNQYFTSISGGINTGLESQCSAEYEFETGRYGNVEDLAVKAFLQAEMMGRTTISICSIFLRGRFGYLTGEQELYYEMRTQLEHYIESGANPIIQCEAECAASYLYAMNLEKSKIAPWIREGDLEQSRLLPEADGIFYITCGLSLLLDNKYKKLLELSSVMEEQYHKRMHVLGYIYMYIYRTIALYKIFRTQDAVSAARKLLEICEKDHIVTPLLELWGYLSEITDDLVYKGTFLEEVRTLYKKYKPETEINSQPYGISLTKKEREVVYLTLQGMSAQEVANAMKISINTVRTHMKSVYRKFNVNSRVGLVRAYENWEEINQE